MCPIGSGIRKKVKTSERALEDLMRECAKAEKSIGDAKRLMTRWGVPPSKRGEVIEQLIDMKFIDHRRYATAYVRDKINLSDWGPQRIRLELGHKEVEEEITAEVLEELFDKEMLRERLLKALTKRKRTTRYKDNYELKNKLLRYGATLGYDYSTISDVLEEVINKREEEQSWLDILF